MSNMDLENAPSTYVLINALNKFNADVHQANSLPFNQQVCRSVKENVVATVTSFDAIPFNRHRTMWHHDHYTKPIIERELRTCMVAMRAPFGHCQREFVTRKLEVWLLLRRHGAEVHDPVGEQLHQPFNYESYFLSI